MEESNELVNDPMLCYLATGFRRGVLFHKVHQVRAQSEASLEAKKARLQYWVGERFVKSIRETQQVRIDLRGLMTCRSGQQGRPFFNALLGSLRGESQLHRGFDVLGWHQLVSHHAGLFDRVEFPHDDRESHVYSGLYLLGVVRDAYPVKGRPWSLDCNRLEEVLEATSVDDLVTRDIERWLTTRS